MLRCRCHATVNDEPVTTSTPDKPPTCSTCRDTIGVAYCLRVHGAVRTVSYRCPKCGQTWTHPEPFRRRPEPRELRHIDCPRCKSSKALIVAALHGGSQLCYCPSCDHSWDAPAQ